MNSKYKVFKYMLRLILATVVLSGTTLHLKAQSVVTDYFTNRDFNQYFLSDHYAPSNRLALGAVMGSLEYDIARQPRNVMAISEPVLGMQLPIYHRYTDRSKFAISIPVSFSVFFDFTEFRTAPIINTDYRFAVVEFNYSRIFNHKNIHNIGVKFIPLFHESTHLGDEVTIARVYVGVPTTRINVSYENIELAVLLNDPYGEVKKNHQFGVTSKLLWNPEKGYYTTDTLEIGTNIEIPPTKRSTEFDFYYQYQNPNGFLSNDRMMFTISQNFQYGVRFGYPIYYRDENNTMQSDRWSENYQLSSNTLVGWQLLDQHQQLTGMGIYLRAYLGRNYHGQFRNIPFYPWLGATVILDASLRK